MIRRASRFAAFALWASGVAALARRVLADRGRFVLEFHGVAARRYPDVPTVVQPSLIASDLERVLHWLSRRFHFLAPDEFLGSDRPGVLLTFDDGFANNHEVVLPLLVQSQAPAIFFVATRHIGAHGRWLGFVEEELRLAGCDAAAVSCEVAHDLFDGMDESQVRSCAASDLVTLGAHTVSHPRLTMLGDDELMAEIVGSKTTLENMAGRGVDFFAYPFGDADDRVVRAVDEAGYRAAFVEGRLPIGLSRHAIPRVGIHRPNPWYLSTKLSGLHESPVIGSILTT